MTTPKTTVWKDKVDISLNFLQDEDLPVKARMKILFAMIPKSKGWLLREIAKALNYPHETHLSTHKAALLKEGVQPDLSPESVKMLRAKSHKEKWLWCPTTTQARDAIRTEAVLASENCGIANTLIDLTAIPTLAGFEKLWAYNTNTTGFWLQVQKVAQAHRTTVWSCLLHVEEVLAGRDIRSQTGAVLSVLREADEDDISSHGDSQKGTYLFTLLTQNRKEPVHHKNRVLTQKDKAAKASSCPAGDIDAVLDDLDNVVSLGAKRMAK